MPIKYLWLDLQKLNITIFQHKALKALPMGCSYVLTCQQYIAYTHTVTVVLTRTSVPVSSDNVYQIIRNIIKHWSWHTRPAQCILPIWLPPSPRDLNLVFDFNETANIFIPSSWISLPSNPSDCKLLQSSANNNIHYNWSNNSGYITTTTLKHIYWHHHLYPATHTGL